MIDDWKDVYCNRILLIKKYLNLDDYERIEVADKKIEKILLEDFGKEELISVLFALDNSHSKEEINSLCKMLLVQYYAYYTDNVEVAKKLLKEGFDFFEKDGFLFVLDKDFQGEFSDDEYVDLVINNKNILANFNSSLENNETFLTNLCQERGLEKNLENVKKLKKEAIKNFSEVLYKKRNICKLSGKAWEDYAEIPDLEIVDDKYEFFLNPVVLLKLDVERIIKLYERQIQMLNNITSNDVLAKICDLLQEYSYYSLSEKVNSHDFFSLELFRIFSNDEILFLDERKQQLLASAKEASYEKLKEVFNTLADFHIPKTQQAIADFEISELLGLDEDNASRVEKIYKKKEKSLSDNINLYLIKKKAQNRYKKNKDDNN